jgi:ABC-type branched-subunit amino acid transport system substrate-binding protein
MLVLSILTGTAAQASATSGKPVKLMVIIDLSNTQGAYAPWLATYQATVKAINASGGINGRPLQLQVCDSASNANSSATCATEAVSEKLPAVVSLAGFGNAYDPILAQAKIPDIGDSLQASIQFTSPISFPLWAGGSGDLAGLGTAAAFLNCKTAAFISSFPSAEVAIVPGLYAAFKGVAVKHGITVGSLIQAPDGSPDFAPYIADALAQGADCIAFTGGDADEAGLLQAARQSGTKAKLIVADGQIPSSTVTSLGSELNGVNAVGITYPSTDTKGHPGVAEWVHDVNKYSSDPNLQTQSANAWASVELFAYVARHVKTVSSATILNALNHLSNYNPGVAPDVSFNKPAPENTLGKRVFNPNVFLAHYQNGIEVPDGAITFRNIETGKPAA